MADKKAANPVDPAPDPDEDDLDELDDVLDEFSATKLDAPAQPEVHPAPGASGPGRPPAAAVDAAVAEGVAATTAAVGALSPEDEFAQQLQAGMADLLGDLQSSPEMQREFEKLVAELGGAAGGAADDADGATASVLAGAAAAGLAGRSVDAGAGETGAGAKDKDAGKAKSGDESFQDAIKRTMERMQESSSSATAAAASGAGDTDDILAQMLKEMEKGGFGGEGGEDDFSKMLMGMMEQLTNKEILYEPMKELDDKFPGWMEKNSDKTPKEDLERYKEQQTLVREIVARFEKSGYSDDNVADREYIVERMQKMQAAGSPPSDLVGDMSAAQEALGELDAGCPTQ